MAAHPQLAFVLICLVVTLGALLAGAIGGMVLLHTRRWSRGEVDRW